MNNNPNITINEATREDFSSVLHHAKSFDLDVENVDFSQFLVAKYQSELVGFGRIIEHDGFSELATLGVVKQKQNIGSQLVKALCDSAKGDLFLVTVIPDFFVRLGFGEVKEYSSVFKKKIDFCKCYHFEDEQIFVMKYFATDLEK